MTTRILQSRIYQYFLLTAASALGVTFLVLLVVNMSIHRAAINEQDSQLLTQTAQSVNALIDNQFKVISTVKATVETFRAEKPARRDSLSIAIVRQVIETQKGISSIVVEWDLPFAEKISTLGFYRIDGVLRPIDGDYVEKSEELESSLRFVRSNLQTAISEPFSPLIGRENVMVASIVTPIVVNGKYGGYVRLDFYTNELQTVFSNIKTSTQANWVILTSKGTIVSHTNRKFKFQGSNYLKQFTESTSQIVKNSILSGRFSSVNVDNGYLMLSPIVAIGESQPWSVGLEIKTTLFSKLNSKLLGLIVLFFIFGLILILLFSILFIRKVITPLREIGVVLAEMAHGSLAKVDALPTHCTGEVGELALNVQILSDNIDRFTRFAKEIGEGNFNYSYELLGQHDLLGKSLLEMKENLEKARIEEQERRKEDEIQNWITHGVASVNEILRLQGLSLKQHMLKVLEYIVDYIGANQGVIFVGKEIENPEDPDISMEFYALSALAWGRKRSITKAYQMGESLVGRCAFECQTLLITDIPKNYVNISSGLGKANPSNLLLVPLLLNQNVYGVIEIAAFNTFAKHHIAFVEKVSESIALVISSQQIAEKTNRLLEQTKIQAEELAQKEEEMRQNIEEMQATQEEFFKRQAEIDALKLAVDQICYVFYLNTSGQFVHANPNYCDFLGISDSQIVGKTMKEFNEIGNPDSMDNYELWGILMRGETVKVVREYNIQNQELFLKEVYSPVRNRDYEISTIICVAQPINKIE